MKYIDKKLLEGLREVLERLSHSENSDMVRVVYIKVIHRFINDCLDNELYEIYRMILRYMRIIILEKANKQSKKQYMMGYRNTLVRIIEASNYQQTEHQKTVEPLVRSMYHFRIHDLSWDNREYWEYINHIYKDIEANIYDNESTKILLGKYNVIIYARILYTHIGYMNYELYNKQIWAMGDSLHEVFPVYLTTNEILGVFENDIESLIWEVPQKLKEAEEAQEKIVSSDLSMACILVAIAIMIDQGLVVMERSSIGEYPLISNEVSAERIEQVLSSIRSSDDDAVDKYAKEIFEAIKERLGAKFAMASKNREINHEYKKKLERVIKKRLEKKYWTLGDKHEFEEVTFTHYEVMPKVLFQQDELQYGMYGYEHTISEVVAQKLKNFVIDKYLKEGEESPREKILNESNGICGYVARLSRKIIKERRNKYDDIWYIADREHEVLIANSNGQVYGVKRVEVELVPISAEEARNAVINSENQFSMYKYADLQDEETLRRLVIKIKIEIKIEIYTEGKKCYRGEVVRNKSEEK